MVATTVRGRIFLPRYHGRVHTEILGEEIETAHPNEKLGPIREANKVMRARVDLLKILYG